MLSVGTAVTVGVVSNTKKDTVEIQLKRPVCAELGFANRHQQTGRSTLAVNRDGGPERVKVLLDANALMDASPIPDRYFR